MKITVNKDNVKIEEFDVVHEGEHRVNKCSFSFSEEYTEELVKKAIFTSQNSSIEVAIINNECDVPTEILKARNIVLLGVYAYKVVDDKLELRYSPSPDAFKVNSGSYIEGANESEEITPSQFEQYMQALNDGLNKVEESLKKMDSATSAATQLVDNINQKLENGDFIGPQGPQGIQGIPGKNGTNGQDGVGITTITSGQSTIEEDKTITPVTVQKSDGSSQSFKVEAKNGIDGQNGQDGQDGQDGVNGQDGLTPSIGENGNWFLGDTDTGKPSRGEVGPTPDLSDYVKNTDYASASKAGVLKINGNAARISSDGVLSAAEVSEEQYKTTVNSIFISKGTLDNVKNFLVESSTPVIRLNNTLDNLVRKNRVSDYIISLKDALKYKVFEFLVHGKTQQETTKGYNLLPYPYTDSSMSINGITFTVNDDGSVTINGTASANASLKLYGKDGAQKQIIGNYLFGGSNNVWLRAVNKSDSGYTVICTSKENSSVAIDKSTYTEGYIELIVPSGTTVNNEIIYPMLSNEKDVEWEPYTGGQPSPSPDYPQPITALTFDKITRCGKNLLPNNLTSQTINGISVIVNDDKSITVNGTTEKRTVFYLYSRNTNEIDYILPKGIDFILKSPGLENVGINFQLGLYEPNKTEEYIIANGINDRQFKLDNYKIINYFALIVEEGQTVDLTCYPQLEIGIESTEYEFYQGQTYDIDLQGNEMVELPNGVKDELVIDKQGNISLIKNTGKAVLTGSENWKDNWQTSTTPDYIQFYLSADFLNNNYINATSKNTLVNRFKTDGSVWIFSKEMLALNKDVTYTLQIKMLRSRVSDLASFKEWLSTHNVIVYYQLATPQTIPLGTLSELITTLNGTNNISINGNIPTTISITYALDIKKYIDNKLAEISSALIEEG